MAIKFGPAGLGPVKTALNTLEDYNKKGLKACEIAFTYSAYIKPQETKLIKEKAQQLKIDLSIHAPYFVNLNSAEPLKIIATKQRILKCCEIGELLGAKTVVFHPGYYGKSTKEYTFQKIKQGIIEIQQEIKQKGWKIKIAPETMGKVNVFGSLEEISQLVQETGCSFCIDFAHILAREKSVNYPKIHSLFPGKEWHTHFSGIVYGDKGEKHHKTTEKSEWKKLLENLPKNKDITIINESPTLIQDSIQGLEIAKKLKLT
jgi:deoxyribonuclease IV